MKNQFPFNRYVPSDKVLDICFEGIYNVVVEIREGNLPLSFLHTASFNLSIAEAAMKQVCETFPNDSVYIFRREADILVKMSERLVARPSSSAVRPQPEFRMTL